MPYGRCPVCGAGYHLNVSLPVDEWYRRYWPQCQVGDEVPGLCFGCWVELRVGHRVTVRTVPSQLAERLTVGTAGTVVAVESDGEPVYVVELDGGVTREGRFRRTDLSCIQGQTPPS
jgi:hypothetical protein